MAMTGPRTHPALLADHHRHRLVHHAHLGHHALLVLNQRAALVAKGLGIGLDLLDHQAPQTGGAAQNVFQPLLLGTQVLEFLLDLDRFQPRQLAQSDFENVLGLPVRQVERLHQRRLGLVALADDADHLVDVQQHDLPAFEDVDAVQHLVQTMLAAPRDGALAEGDPLLQHRAQRLLHRLSVDTDRGQVDRRRGLQTGLRQQRGDQVLLAYGAALGLEHQPHRGFLARFVAHAVQHRQHAGLELQLVLTQRLLAGLDLGIGQLLDLFQHLLRANVGRQFVDHHLPLSPRQILDGPARTHLEAAAAAAVGIGNIGRAADDLATARKIRPRQQRQQVLFRQLGVLHQRHAGISHFAQVVAGNLGRHAHGNAAGAVEQCKRQARRQLRRLLGGTVVIGHEVHRALIDLVQQQRGNLRQPCLGVTHGGSTVAIARAEVALAIDQRVTLRKILRHAHQCIVGRLIAVRMETAQHVAHHARALHRLGTGSAIAAAKGQAHAVHRIQDAALHRLLAVAHIGQRAPFHHAQRIFQIGALGVLGEVGVVILRQRRGGIGLREIVRSGHAG